MVQTNSYQSHGANPSVPRPTVKVTDTAAWQHLTQLRDHIQAQRLKIADLFTADPQRFSQFHLILDNLVLDFSKSLIDQKVLSALLALAAELDLPKFIQAFFAGQPLNFTEHRAVLHHLLRADGQSATPAATDATIVAYQQEIAQTLARMRGFVQAVHSGQWRGYSGQAITDVVHIGIGGSQLGASMVVRALESEHGKLRAHFISNVDPNNLRSVLATVSAERTLFVIASKSFATQETLTNASFIKQWFLAQLPADANTAEREAALAQHLIAVTAKPERAQQFGVGSSAIFPFWDWVGGRFSMWSAIGVTIALALGVENFDQLLAGAHVMDEHFRTAPLAQNLPVIMGLVGIWYHNFLQADSLAIVPYNHYLQLLPAYLQQVEMESNGKSINFWGEPVNYTTAPIVWGACGTDSQHSFHQLLMQGTRKVAVDFILTAKSGQLANYTSDSHVFDAQIVSQQQLLLANGLAQSRALMRGKNATDVYAELAKMQPGLSADQQQQLTPHKLVAGNVSHNLILLPQLNAYYLGMLAALYEHKVAVQGFIWQINSFDQWGVELGKQLAKELMQNIQTTEKTMSPAQSTPVTPTQPVTLDNTTRPQLDGSTLALLRLLAQYG